MQPAVVYRMIIGINTVKNHECELYPNAAVLCLVMNNLFPHEELLGSIAVKKHYPHFCIVNYKDRLLKFTLENIPA